MAINKFSREKITLRIVLNFLKLQSKAWNLKVQKLSK